ncbi:hypothetical protein OO015_05015 [Thermomicrobium sp. 4228-Ro]|uniref:hypothetical protein n=1 Tax=Thermomicrobium sp. 4228-Ro TaxID=2993937 RepID=UPI00224988C9|nr:hypothetical protein [Thermomicrobium sp. 4228-Ro]MCX2726852.1 hypothetical protein [Thermomicrobium sp. 4228-Ro]
MNGVARLPLVAVDAECCVRRRFITPEFQVSASQLVEPETVVAVAAAGVERSVQIAVAVELGVPPQEAARCLVRALGERVEAGEVVAARRRGLRTQQVTSPITGRLERFDEQTGSLLVVAEAPRRPVRALVAGEVRAVQDDTVEIAVVGDLVHGTVLLGPECAGPLVVLADRPDRELPIEEFDERCRGAVVLAGMTVGSAVLRRLEEVGAAGVIVGGISVSALEPFVGGRADERLRTLLEAREAVWSFSFGLLLVEGFGRLPLAHPLFAFLQERNGRWVSLLRADSVGVERPVALVSSRSFQGIPLEPVPFEDGIPVHVDVPARPGVGYLRSAPFLSRTFDGAAFPAVLVERDGRIEQQPVDLVTPLGISP